MCSIFYFYFYFCFLFYFIYYFILSSFVRRNLTHLKHRNTPTLFEEDRAFRIICNLVKPSNPNKKIELFCCLSRNSKHVRREFCLLLYCSRGLCSEPLLEYPIENACVFHSFTLKYSDHVMVWEAGRVSTKRKEKEPMNT